MPVTATSRGLGLGHVDRRSEPPVGLAEASLQLHPRPTSPSAGFCRLTSSWVRVDFRVFSVCLSGKQTRASGLDDDGC